MDRERDAQSDGPKHARTNRHTYTERKGEANDSQTKMVDLDLDLVREEKARKNKT